MPSLEHYPRGPRLLAEAVALMRDYSVSHHHILDLTGDDGMLLRPRPGETLKDLLARAHPAWYPIDPGSASWRELALVPA